VPKTDAGAARFRDDMNGNSAIDTDSPLPIGTSSSLAESAEIVVTVAGLTLTLTGRFGQRFAPVRPISPIRYFGTIGLWTPSCRPRMGLAIHYRQFHNTERIQSQ
jgi:hypothetical protein